MKKLLFSVLCALFVQGLTAQGDRLPLDAQVRYGKLPNGMTYYIRHNDYPGKLAHFEIFHSVGAMQEEDNQNGLAHFLEHLAFNGLKHFPGKSMLEYMESIGVKFGANVNASTSTEYTRYLLKDVPTTRQGILDTCLLVLHDWSGSILAEQEEIDSERGVIQEEWRARGGAQFRIHQALIPYIFKGSKFARRNVIGDMDIVRNFKRQELLDFYHTWYRPDFQAVAVVGDFDLDAMEKQVVELFSKLPAVHDGKAKEKYSIPDNRKLLYVAYDDPEIPSASVDVMYKHPARSDAERATFEGYAEDYRYGMVVSMMNRRVREKVENGSWPLTGIGYSYGNLAGDRDIFSMSASIKPGAENISPAFDMLLAESEQLRRYGFTAGELELQKAESRKYVERAWLEREKRVNDRFINDYFSHFLRNNPFMGMDDYCEVCLKIIDGFTLESANATVGKFFGRENMIAAFISPKSDASGVPSQKAVEKALSGMSKLKVAPYKDKATASSLLEREPTAGRVVSEEPFMFGATLWTLSNGAKVYLLPTTAQKNEILLDVFSLGGLSRVSDDDYVSARAVTLALGASGVGRMSATELEKYLTGKTVYVTPIFAEFQEKFGCATTPADFGTTLEVLHAYFTAPRFDREATDRKLAQLKENLLARRNVPMAYMQDTVLMRRNSYNPRSSNMIIDPAEVERVDMERIRAIYARTFDNPQQFVWTIVGSFAPDSIRPLVEKYIGSLTGPSHDNSWVDHGKRSPAGRVFSDFKRPMEAPAKSTVFIEYTRPAEYSLRKSLTIALLQHVLDIRYTKLIREDKGGTYSVDVEGSMGRLPAPVMRLIVSFTSDPALIDGLMAEVHPELERLVAEGIDPADLGKAREFVVKSIVKNRERNFYWQWLLNDYLLYGDDTSKSDEIVAGITLEEVHATLKELVDAGNILTVVMRPE